MIPAEFLVVFFGLAAAASWGAGDFSGGLATKRSSVYSVVIITQVVGLIMLTLMAYVFSEQIPPLNSIAWGCFGGIVGSIGIIALYRALAQGNMGIVAPVSAVVAVTIPVIYGTLNEGMPTINQIAGFGVALTGVWLIASNNNGAGTKLSDLTLPAIAGLSFGIFFISIDNFSEVAIFWPLAVARLTAMLMLICFVAMTKNTIMPVKSMLPIIIVAGIFETGGNMFFALASQVGRLDIATVTSSLYPGSTVLLAWFVLKEKMTPRQWIGVIAALVAIVLISI